MQLNYAQKTDIGLQRQINQDYLGVYTNASGLMFFVMADGVATTNQGNIASKTVVELLGNAWITSELTEVQATKDFIVEQSQDINKKIRGLSKNDSENTKMATTFVGLVFFDQQVLSINAGDSRSYQFNAGELIQLSQDHSLAAEMIRSAGVSEEQAANIQDGSRITRYFGSDVLPEFDTKVVDYSSQDQFLIATDGLTKQVDEDEIIAILKDKQDVEKKVDQLITKANDNSGSDNVSVIAIEVQE